MRVGAFYVPTDESAPVAAVATAADALGFDSLLFGEHTHIPTGTVAGLPAGFDVPRSHRRSLDPFICAAVAAMSAGSLRVGTCVCLVTARDPIITAKEVATVDRLSGGRFIFGIGAGWNRPEIRNHGIDPAVRMDVLVERVGAMQAIWCNDTAEYHGEFVDFDAIEMWPKPLQEPHPPILLGGSHPNAARRAAAIGAAWMPNLARTSVAAVEQVLRSFGEHADRIGLPAPPLILFRADPSPESVVTYRSVGAEGMILALPSATESEIVGILSSWASHLELTNGVTHLWSR